MIEQKVATIHELKDGEMKEVALGSKKALLSRINGEFFATGNLCTHYKANLVKGALTPEGRVTCPLHGACFHVKTGEVEDAPGIDALTTYQVKIEGEDVIIVADEAKVEEGRRVPNCTTFSPDEPKVFVIIGGGPAGFLAASTLREEGFRGKVVMISSEDHLPIDRVKLSKSLKIEVQKILLRGQDYFAKANIDTVIGKTVTKVDPVGQVVYLNDGLNYRYDSLFIATGGTPRFFWGDASRFKNVFLLRGVNDANLIDQAMAEKTKPDVVIVGSSFIGMEAACMLVKEAKSVTVIGMEKVPFERVLGEKIGGLMQQIHEAKGIKFLMGAVVATFDEGEEGKCISITLKNGEKIPADFVVVGAGVAPATGFLKGTFNLEQDGSILVDRHMKVKQFDNIYAGGDIARYEYEFNAGHAGTVRIEHWNVASQQGRVAARNMAGKKVELKLVPFFWTAQYGKTLRYVGHALNYDDIIFEGKVDPTEPSFVAYYVKGEEILAVASFGKDPACANAAELMRMGKLPKASEIRAGKSVMDYTSIVYGSQTATTSSSSSSSSTVEKKKILPPASPARPKKDDEGSPFMKVAPLLFLLVALGLGWFFFFKK